MECGIGWAVFKGLLFIREAAFLVMDESLEKMLVHYHVAIDSTTWLRLVFS